MRAGKSCKYKLSCPRVPWLDLHSGQFFVNIDSLIDVGKIKAGIDAEHHHVDRKRNDINVSGPLTVTEQSALYPVATGHKTEF